MKYTIIIKREALKELAQLPKPASVALTAAIETLAENPRPQGCKKLKGSKENLWRVRVGNYRIIYLIDDVIRIVNVRTVGNRKDVY